MVSCYRHCLSSFLLHLLALVVLKLDMQTIFDTDLHLDGIIRLGSNSIALNEELLLLDQVSSRSHPTIECNSKKVAQPDIDAVIGLVRLLYIWK